MKRRLRKILRRCLSSLRRYKIFAPLVKSLDKWSETLYFSRMSKAFVSYGIEVIKELDELLHEYGIPYSMAYGTLLGAVREGGPIAHDLDMDLFLWDYDPSIVEKLAERGFMLVHEFLVDEGKSAREQTFMKKGVSVDFFYVYADEDHPSYNCSFAVQKDCRTFQDAMDKYGYVLVRREQMPISRALIRLPYAGVELSAIANYDEFLEACYGADYLTPNSEYSHTEVETYAHFTWKEKRGVYIDYH